MQVALVNNDGFSTYQFRKRLILELVRLNHEVTVIVPPSDYDERIKQLGVRVYNIKLARFHSFFGDVSFFWNLYVFLKKSRFDIVHNMTIKPNIYGTIAAKLASVPRIFCLVPGAGYVFAENTSVGLNPLKLLIKLLYKLAMLHCEKVWFQNQDDFQEFCESKIIKKSQGIVIRSSGVDIDKYSQKNLLPDRCLYWKSKLAVKANDKVIVMVVARLIKSKGVDIFLEVARGFQAKNIDCKFVLVAPAEISSYEVLEQSIFQNSGLNNFVYLDNFVDDIEHILGIASVVCLPSYYSEGVPRVLLEAMALSKPIVTTSSPGCKETVQDGLNGFLVKPKDAGDLEEKLTTLIKSTKDISKFGDYSRYLAETYFSDKYVSQQVISKLYQLNTD